MSLNAVVKPVPGTDLWIASCPKCGWEDQWACSDKEECEKEARWHRCRPEKADA
jgi:hypothetical protein